MDWRNVSIDYKEKIIIILATVAKFKKNFPQLNQALNAAIELLKEPGIKKTIRWDKWLANPKIRALYSGKFVAVHSDCGIIAYAESAEEVRKILEDNLVDIIGNPIIITGVNLGLNKLNNAPVPTKLVDKPSVNDNTSKIVAI